MIGFIHRLLGGGTPSLDFDLDKEVGKFISSLPQCSQHVVVASDRYFQKYHCEVFVPAVKLAPFVRSLSDSTLCGSRESEVALKAMPQWLDGASNTDGNAIYLPNLFVEIVDTYVLNFINEGSATVICKDCGHAIKGIVEGTSNRVGGAGPWSEWTASWHCPVGHLLYVEEQEIHIYRVR